MTCSNYCDYGCDPEGECEAWFSLPYLSSPPDPKTRSINPYFRSLKEKSGGPLQAGVQAAQGNPTGEAVPPTASHHKVEGVSKRVNTSKSSDTTCATETEEVLDFKPSSELGAPSGFGSDIESDAGSSTQAVAGSIAGAEPSTEQEAGSQPKNRRLLWLIWKLESLEELKGPVYLFNAIQFVRTFVENFAQMHRSSKFSPIEMPFNFRLEELPVWYPTYREISKLALGETRDDEHYVALATFLYMAAELNPYYSEIKEIISIRLQEIHPLGPELLLAMAVDCNVV